MLTAWCLGRLLQAVLAMATGLYRAACAWRAVTCMRAQLQLQGRGWLQASLVEYVYARALTLEFRPTAPSRTRNRAGTGIPRPVRIPYAYIRTRIRMQSIDRRAPRRRVDRTIARTLARSIAISGSGRYPAGSGVAGHGAGAGRLKILNLYIAYSAARARVHGRSASAGASTKA